MNVPNPIPYRGSKRQLASSILSSVPDVSFETWFEPFAGSASLTLACASRGLGSQFHLNDIFEPLMGIWRHILSNPHSLISSYRSHWNRQLESPKEYYNRVRSTFNEEGGPERLLYLLARCVKNAVRFNADGDFNQSADHRRLGRSPRRMEREIWSAHRMLSGRTTLSSRDYKDVLDEATPHDIVYMDPPYLGDDDTRGGNQSYVDCLDLDRLVSALVGLNERGVPYIVSLDGSRGGVEYGQRLPVDVLDLQRVDIEAGLSSQGVLNGCRVETVESLYLSHHLSWSQSPQCRGEQLEIPWPQGESS